MPVTLLIPVTGNSSLFPSDDFYFPKPLVEVAGKPMLIQVADWYQKHLDISRIIFIIPSDVNDKFSVSEMLKSRYGDLSTVLPRPPENDGALCSALLACDVLSDEELVIANMDEVIDHPLDNILDHFRESGADCGITCFESSHPRWCYASISNNIVNYLSEKKPISSFALAGLYYFRNKEIFLSNASQAVLDGDSINGKFYISSAVNQAILKGQSIHHFTIQSRNYYSFYSPEMLSEFQATTLFSSMLTRHDPASEPINLVIPAAGKGSRFSNLGWKKPKPFIDINCRPMLEHVLDNLWTANSRPILLFNQAHTSYIDQFKNASSFTSDYIVIPRVTDGTACTVLASAPKINCNTPLLIANSDQLVDFDISDFYRDALTRNLDGSILVFTDSSQNPKWSFARCNAEGLVEEVREKEPISSLATVGIYYFRSGSQFVESVGEMIAANDRINGEFYTCPVYNYMIRKGLKVGVYEIPFSSMHGIGTPDDLQKYLNDKGYPPSSDSPDDA